MDVLVVLAIAFACLLYAAMQGIAVLYPLLLALLLVSGVYWRRGTPLISLANMMKQGVQQSWGVLSVLLLIGTVVAGWLVAGTVPALVYYGLQLIHPRWFVLSAFVLTSGVSVLLGTSFGTAGTMGLALMIMARGADIDPHWVAGAVIAGAYVGDRCSPMSSSAHLVAAITHTNPHDNLRRMLATGWGALGLSVVIYGIASLHNPLSAIASPLLPAIPARFTITPSALLPAGLLVVLTLGRVPMLWTLVASLGSAIALALSLQGQSPFTVLQILITGLHLPAADPLSAIFIGGGLISMAQVGAIVVVSTALAGVLAEMKTFDQLGDQLSRWPGGRGRFGGTLVAGSLTAAFGCTQTMAILLTQKIVQPRYRREGCAQGQLAVDIENTAVVLAPLIPWNIAGLVPATILMTDASFIPFAVYLYLLPLLNWLLTKPGGGGE